ncbi:MAG TPA: toll/interleukin-1 receptor domain-containing protein [Puia sp.]|nr:toll/interleukin-1 receptor domain-containing protein [Puia sp.]
MSTSTSTSRGATACFAFDVFISYRQLEPDLPWVRNILAPALEAPGLRVCIDYRDFRLGRPVIREMERGVETSKFTLAILSPAYLESGFTELENILAQSLGLEKAQRRLICMMYQPCRPRLGIRSAIWMDMTDQEKFTANLPGLIRELHSSPDE